jgi:hypothetical protein
MAAGLQAAGKNFVGKVNDPNFKYRQLAWFRKFYCIQNQGLKPLPPVNMQHGSGPKISLARVC